MRATTFLPLLFAVLSCRPPAHAAARQSGPERGEVWMASHLAGRKVGYSVVKFARDESGYRFDDLMRMTLSMMGRTQDLRVRASAVTAADLTLKEFTFEMTSQDLTFSGEGRMEGGRLMMTGGPTGGTRVLELSGPVYPVEALGLKVLGMGLKSGERATLLTFDGTVMDTMSAEVEMLGPDRVASGTETMPATKVAVTRAKLRTVTWLDPTGLPVAEESPLGLESRRATEEQALAGAGEGATLDVLTLFRVPVDTGVPEPGKVRRAVLELTGVDTTEFDLAGPEQTVLSRNPLRLEIRRAEPAAGVRLPMKEPAEFLRPSLIIQCDDTGVVARARRIVGSEGDATAAARLLQQWVSRNLRKQATASLPNAVDVLRSMSGDCNEHAVLYAALCRAAGIPARVAVGLVYLERAFYYHAWNEVLIGRWVSVDATFDEFPAGALHLALSRGELAQQAQILGVVRRIGIRVVEFE